MKVTKKQVERFMKLYRGWDRRFGRLREGQVKDTGKMEGVYETLHVGPAAVDFEGHLNGESSIGIIPLTKENTCHFFALDIDKYDGLNHADLAKRAKPYGALVTRSKSGGGHVYFFTNHTIPATMVDAYMKRVASDLGVASCEKFPKQTSRAKADDVGNWLNMPYFGKHRRGVLIDKDGDPYDASLDEFLDAAEALAEKTTSERLADLTPKKGPRATKTTGPDFQDGPACITRLLKDGVTEGGRNNFLTHCAIYLSRKYGLNKDAILGKIYALNENHDINLPGTEIEQLVNSVVKKKEYFYMCQQIPMVNICDRVECLKRTFGIGSKKDDLPCELGSYTKVMADDPYYIFSADGKRVIADNESQILNPNKFQELIFKFTGHVFPVMGKAKHDDIVRQLQTGSIEVPPDPDTDPKWDIIYALGAYLVDNRTDDRAKINQGFAKWDKDEKFAEFRLTEFKKYLRKERIKFEDRKLAVLLKDEEVKPVSGKVDGTNTRLYRAEIEKFINPDDPSETQKPVHPF
jgi:hypothetical protein